jgi:hypothetical protein
MSVITGFSKVIFDKFCLNISKYPTTPSIAFAIFRLSFLTEETITKLKGEIYSNIKQSYYGGFVDIYTPFARVVKSYDVNSLYPFSMFKQPMPIGNPTYFVGQFKKIKDLFGFVKVKVLAPDMRTPILPVRVRVNGIISTLYPTGS